MAINTITEIPIQASPLGENFAIAKDVTGPASYANPGGQIVSATFFGLLSGIRFAVAMGITNDGLNTVYATTPGGSGKSTIVLRWFVTATGAEVANAVNLAGKKIRILAIGN